LVCKTLKKKTIKWAIQKSLLINLPKTPFPHGPSKTHVSGTRSITSLVKNFFQKTASVFTVNQSYSLKAFHEKKQILIFFIISQKKQ